MKRILFADLDDTLFQSHRQATPGKDWVSVAYLADGSPVCYASPLQQSMLAFFQSEMVVIPVTARDLGAFRRVSIEFRHEAILNYGGVILNGGGEVDEVWLERSRRESAAALDTLQRWQELLEEECIRAHLDFHVRLISDCDTTFYLVAKSKSGNVDAIERARQFCERVRLEGELPACRIHANGNNLAVLPIWLSKGDAVAYLRARYEQLYGEVVTFGMGDSLTDLDFMRTCEFMVVPRSSQIAEQALCVQP